MRWPVMAGACLPLFVYRMRDLKQTKPYSNYKENTRLSQQSVCSNMMASSNCCRRQANQPFSSVCMHASILACRSPRHVLRKREAARICASRHDGEQQVHHAQSTVQRLFLRSHCRQCDTDYCSSASAQRRRATYAEPSRERAADVNAGLQRAGVSFAPRSRWVARIT